MEISCISIYLTNVLNHVIHTKQIRLNMIITHHSKFQIQISMMKSNMKFEVGNMSWRLENMDLELVHISLP